MSVKGIEVVGALAAAALFRIPPPLSGGMPPRRPRDFGFIVRYQSCITREIDSFNGTRGLGDSPDHPEKRNFRFTPASLDRIYRAMADIRTMSYPDDFVPRTATVVPRTVFSPSVRRDGRTKALTWEGVSSSADARGKI
jgi:hypothetical protein